MAESWKFCSPSSRIFRIASGYTILGLACLLGFLSYAFPDAERMIFLFCLALLLAIFLILSPGSKPKETLLSPEQYLARARRLFQEGKFISAEKNYSQAIYHFYQRGLLERAGSVFEEYFRGYQRVFAPKIQLHLCQQLCKKGKYLLSAQALETLIQEWEQLFKHHSPRYLEQAYLHLARIYGEKLDLPTLAIDRYFEFLERFPNSPWRETAIFQIQLLDEKLSRVLKRVA